MSVFGSADDQLEPERVAEALAQGWQVVDVREPYEREAGYIAGSQHIALEHLAARAATLDRRQPVVFYCRLGQRSAMATQAFRTSGYEAYNLSGGISEWVRRGLAIEPADGHVAEH